MTNQEALSFVRAAIPVIGPQRWADLGCGSGTFTRALSALLPPGSDLVAIDREIQNFSFVSFMRADFEKDVLELAELDGILMANSLHYVADQTALIRKLEKLFAGSPRFVLIEYDTRQSNPWVPYAVPFDMLPQIFAGYKIEKMAEKASNYGGRMYCALITRN